MSATKWLSGLLAITCAASSSGCLTDSSSSDLVTPESKPFVTLLGPSPSDPARYYFSVSGLPASQSSTITIYADGTCHTSITTSPTQGLTALQFYLEFIRSASGDVSVNAVDGANGKTTPCSNSVFVDYEPLTLSLHGTASPGTNTEPTIEVDGVTSGEVVGIYTDSGCSNLVGIATASTDYALVTVSTPLAPGSYAFYAKAGASAGCSTASVRYILQGTTGAMPSSLSLSTPVTSPSDIAQPTILVSGVGNGDTIRLYADSVCSASVGYNLSNGTSATIQVSSSLAPGTYHFFATDTPTGGTSSPCSTATVDYVVTAPTAPTLLSLSTPSISPSYLTQPTISVSGTQAGFQVNLYSDSACTTLVGSASSGGSTYSIRLNSTLATGSYNFYATALNHGVSSPCSTATVAYTVARPSAPSSLTLVSPSSSPSYITLPTVSVMGTIATATIKIYSDSSCTQLIGTANASGSSVNVTATTPLVLGSNTIYATQSYTGNASNCSSAYLSYAVQPTSAPTSVALTFPTAPPSYFALAQFSVGGTFSGATVTLFTDSACTNAVGQATASGTSTTVATAVPFTAGIYSLFANQSFSSIASTCSTVSASYQYEQGPEPTAASARGQQATNFQIDAAHSGYTSFGTPLSFPSSPTWSANFTGRVSYPLIVNGLVYVTVADAPGTTGTQLYALTLATGAIAWGPVAIPSNLYNFSGITYDAGKIFAVTVDKILYSFNAATGAAGWSTNLGGSWIDSAPTAANGLVYVFSNGRLVAVQESNGAIDWTANPNNGTSGSPTVTSNGVVVSAPRQLSKFDLDTGATIWQHVGNISGGGGATTVFANGALYVPDWTSPNYIADEAAGGRLGLFPISTGTVSMPAVGPTTAAFLGGGNLIGTDLSGSSVSWTFAGDGNLITAPIMIDGTVIVGSSTGKLYAVDALTGTQLWSASAGTTMSPTDDMTSVANPTGLNAAQNYLVAPAGTTLTGWKITGP